MGQRWHEEDLYGDADQDAGTVTSWLPQEGHLETPAPPFPLRIFEGGRLFFGFLCRTCVESIYVTRGLTPRRPLSPQWVAPGLQTRRHLCFGVGNACIASAQPAFDSASRRW